MAKLSLKVNVGGRTYPLSVNEGEEQRVLNAAEDINKSIKMLQENYAVKDMQDLLAMSSLQLSSRQSSVSSVSNTASADYSKIESELDALNKELDSLD
jgi:cell division protein ZapA (FtsZ GTPase activity inhibitor)